MLQMIKIGLGLHSRPGTSEPPAPPTGVLAMDDIARDRLVYDSGAALGGSTATVPLAGTGTAGRIVQARALSLDDGGASSSNWTDIATIAGDGTWGGSLTLAPSASWYRAETRLKDEPIVRASAPSRFGVGHVFALWGQSELARMWATVHSLTPPEPVTDGEAVQMIWHDRITAGPGGIQQRFISDADPHTAAFAAMANAFAAALPGAKIAVVHHTVSGTGFGDVTSDAATGRDFADEVALNAFATAGGASVGLVYPSWFAGPRVYGADYDEAFKAAFLGVDDAGLPLSLPVTLFPGEGSKELVLDHTIASLYAPGSTAIARGGPHRFSITSADFSGSGLSAIEAARTSYRAVTTASSPFTVIPAVEAMDYLNGEPQTAGSYDPLGTDWGDISHPNRRGPDGQSRLAKIIAHGLVEAAGLAAWSVPEFDQCTWEPDGSFVEVWSSAGPLTTTELARGGSAAVAGFEINTDEALNASIAAGRVRILPNGGPFTSTDTLTFGRYGGTGMREFPDDFFNATWARYPLVEAGLADLEGIAVRPLPDPAILANTLIGGAEFTTASTGPYFLDPNTLGSGVGRLFFKLDLTPEALSTNAILAAVSGNNYFKLEALANGALRLNVRDSANTVLVNAAQVAGIFTTGQSVAIQASVDLAAGYARIWVNDVQQIDASFTSPSGLFPSSRLISFLASNTGGTQTVASVRDLVVWKDATPDGADPAGAPFKAIAGDAATVNADPWKRGTDAI